MNVVGQGGSVQVSWTPTVADEGTAPVLGYRVRRYGAGGVGVDAGPACSGVVVTTACIEDGVPDGSWRYAVTPVLHAWSGHEGPWSAAIDIGQTDPAPVVTAVAIRKSLGGQAGWIRSGGAFHIYADIDGPTSTVVTAEASGFGVGPSVALSAAGGPWVVDGTTYGWRSQELTAGSSLADATTPFSVTAVDGSGRSSSRTGSATVDDVAPAPFDVTTTDVSRPGTMDAGDRITFTFSEPVEAGSILTDWSGDEIDAVVRVTEGGTGADALTFWDGGNAVQLRLGTLTLGRTDYVSATMTFGAAGTRSRVRVSGSTVIVTLGGPSAAGSVVVGGTGTGTMRWTPRTGMWDRAGNACPTTGINERGLTDREF